MKIITLTKTIYRRATVLLGAALLFGAGSCEMLDVEPKELTKDKDFLKNFWDADFMIRGAYQGLQNIVEPTVILGEARADWVSPGTGADNDILELTEHRVTQTNRYTNWAPYYDLINRANYAIENLPRVPRDSTYFNYKTLMQLTGEAKFLRALAYFHLVRNFQDVPLVKKSISDISQVEYIGASPANTVLDYVEADLKDAFKYADVRIMVLNTFAIGYRESNEQTRMRATKGVVGALQAQVYLWRNKYTEAWDVLSALEVLAETNSTHWSGPGFFGNESWYSFFTTPVVFQEFLLDVAFTYSGREINPLMRVTSNDPAAGGKHLIQPSMVAIKTYHPNYPVLGTTAAGSDIHRGFGRSFAGSAPYYNRVGSTPVIWKWLGTGVVNASNVNVPPPVRPAYESEALFRMFRVSELYLQRAEALNRLNRKAEAITALNSVRQKTGLAATTLTAASTTEAIEDGIMEVRGLELGFEGYRWYDLIRIANHRNSPQYLIDAVKRRAAASQQTYLQNRLSDTKYWYLPYNEKELRLNPSLKQKNY
jgi:starch-binding outer membrane protein, SusD/RagB family